MKIEITYNDGKKFISFISNESYKNIISCFLDDISVYTIHN